MSREIKFRVWDVQKHKMHYLESTDENHNHYLQTGSGGFWLYSSADGKLICNYRSGDLLQFTGLKDKNKVDVYEGDILQMYKHDDNTHQHEKGKVWRNSQYDNDIRDIKFSSGTFYTSGEYSEQAFMHMARPGQSFEVIGNIYEHPHLLQKQ